MELEPFTMCISVYETLTLHYGRHNSLRFICNLSQKLIAIARKVSNLRKYFPGASVSLLLWSVASFLLTCRKSASAAVVGIVAAPTASVERTLVKCMVSGK